MIASAAESEREFLRGRAIGVSVSDSPDLDVLGLSALHVQDAAVEVARHILVAGGELVYGGDLRRGGFTQLLFELVARHWREGGGSAGRGRRPPAGAVRETRSAPAMTNYLAWPVHATLSQGDLEGQVEGFGRSARVVLLDQAGKVIARRSRPPPAALTAADWDDGLSAMRRFVTERLGARLALGGRVEGYKGRMPGVAEEVLLALRAECPVYLLGGFGGCVRDIAETIGLATASPARPDPSRRAWAGREQFGGLDPTRLANGLRSEENMRLAETTHIDEAMTLVLRGLRRVVKAAADRSSSTPRGLRVGAPKLPD